MPRYNNQGRTAKFLYGSRGGGSGGRGVRFDDDVRPHVKFATVNRNSKAIQRKGRGPFYPQKVDESGDVVMDSTMGGGSSQFIRGGRGGRGGRGRGGRGDFHGSSRGGHDRRREQHTFGQGWHRVTIFNGSSYQKEYILHSLANTSRTPFIPFTYAVLGNNAVFYVEDRSSAEAIAECSGKISSPTDSNQKIQLKINITGTPLTAKIDDKDCEDKIRLALEKRYDPNQFSLSLENFYKSPDFINDYYLPLMRPSVTSKIFSILDEILPTLVALDLSKNKLTCLDNFGILKSKSPNLKILVLTENRIHDVFQLDKIEGIGVEQLILTKNPVCDKYEDKELYIRDVRKRLPKIIKLDGVDIGPKISFDLSEPTKVPSVKGSFFINDEAKRVVHLFLEQYMKIYDSDDRKPLADAYHENATMSLAVSYSQSSYATVNPATRLSHYLGDSRNLLRVQDKTKRFKLLHNGRAEVVEFLDKLTKTAHDQNSFVVDMPLALAAFVVFHVFGIFKERPTSYVRAFHRTFSLVPLNQGFVILNDMMCITNPTPEQLKEAFKLPAAPTPSSSPVPYVQQTPAIPGPSSSINSIPIADPEIKRQMIEQFSQQSGMNNEWSIKCLEQNEWDFAKSGQVFLDLRTKGLIPPEAFVK